MIVTELDLMAYDKHNRTSFHREIEMITDSLTDNQTLQFWQDARIYGIQVAFQYLGHDMPDRVKEIQDKVHACVKKHPNRWTK